MKYEVKGRNQRRSRRETEVKNQRKEIQKKGSWGMIITAGIERERKTEEKLKERKECKGIKEKYGRDSEGCREA